MGGALAALGLVTSLIELFTGPQEDPVMKAIRQGFDETLQAIDGISDDIENLSDETEFHIYNADNAREVGGQRLVHSLCSNVCRRCAR